MRDNLNRAPSGQATAKDDVTTSTLIVLDDDHPMWAQHTGLDGHRLEPEWSSADLKRAQTFYGHVNGKAKIFLDLLIDHPGRVLCVDELCELSGGVFMGSLSVAGSASGLQRPYRESGRRYPFYWWKGKKGERTSYAMKPTVAKLFHQARNNYN